MSAPATAAEKNQRTNPINTPTTDSCHCQAVISMWSMWPVMFVIIVGSNQTKRLHNNHSTAIAAAQAMANRVTSIFIVRSILDCNYLDDPQLKIHLELSNKWQERCYFRCFLYRLYDHDPCVIETSLPNKNYLLSCLWLWPWPNMWRSGHASRTAYGKYERIWPVCVQMRYAPKTATATQTIKPIFDPKNSRTKLIDSHHSRDSAY